jgi:hypothetical protein
MDTHATLPIDYQQKLLQLSQGMLYIYNETGEKLPVAVIRGFSFDAEGNVHFDVAGLPLIAGSWQSYAAELNCYKKGVPYSIQLSGTAFIDRNEKVHIQFNIQQIDYCGEEEKPVKNTYLGKWNLLKYLLPGQTAQSGQHHFFKLS